MRQAREIIRLKFSASLPTREIAAAGLGPRTFDCSRGRWSVWRALARSWPLPDGIGDAELEAALFANRRRESRIGDTAAMPSRIGFRGPKEGASKRKHDHSSLIVWDEYVAANPGGYSYSRFCETLSRL